MQILYADVAFIVEELFRSVLPLAELFSWPNFAESLLTREWA